MDLTGIFHTLPKATHWYSIYVKFKNRQSSVCKVPVIKTTVL